MFVGKAGIPLQSSPCRVWAPASQQWLHVGEAYAAEAHVTIGLYIRLSTQGTPGGLLCIAVHRLEGKLSNHSRATAILCYTEYQRAKLHILTKW